MRRMIPVLIALLLLAGCGGEAATLCQMGHSGCLRNTKWFSADSSSWKQ